MLTQKIATIFQYTQAVPADTWVIEHNLGVYPVIDIYVDHNGEKQKILPAGVTYDNLNQCTVTFSAARTGLATVT